MARLFTLAEISDLGRRDVDGPTADDVAWAGMTWGTDEIRVLQAAAQPTLMMAALAGYETPTMWLFAPGEADALEVDLAARTASPVPAEGLDAFVLVSGAATLSAVLAVPTRAGLTTAAVDLGDLVSVVRLDPLLVLPVGTTRTPVAVVSALAAAQLAPATAMAQYISAAATTGGTTTTGLVSILDPDLWDFPDAVLPEGSGERAELLRAVVRPIAHAALQDQNRLLAFLLEEALARTRPALPSVQARLTGTVDPPTQVPVDDPLSSAEARDAEAAWKREAQALHDLVFPDATTRPPFRLHDHRRLTTIELVLDAANHSLFGTLALAPGGQLAYGGYDLRYARPAVPPEPETRTDVDPDPALVGQPQAYVYGGQVLTGTFAAVAQMPRHVQDLRADLAAIGFGPLADADLPANSPAGSLARRTFGPWLEAAVREFQVYASMPRVARRPLATEPQPGAGNASLASTLVPVENDHVYDGPSSGVLNARTRELLRMWVERDWHCPVVVETRTLTNARAAALRSAGPGDDRTPTVLASPVHEQNVWLAREVPLTDRAFIVWDHTGTTSALPYHAGEPMVLCGYSASGWGGAYLAIAGLNSSSVVYPSAEITPATVLPAGTDRATRPAALSTLRVIRAVSEVECLGYLDGINGWDTAITSGGPMHQTLGLLKNSAGNNPATPTSEAVLYPGELGAFLEYLAALEPAEFAEHFGRYGVAPATPWNGAGGPQFVPAHRKYTGFVAQQAEDGSWVDPRRRQQPGVNPVASRQDAVVAETFKTWHWTHRILYCSRSSRIAARRVWEFSRARVRELLSTTWRVNGVEVPMTDVDADGNAVSRPATMGDIFTCERTVAPLVRQHVYSPPHLFGVQDRAAQWTGVGAPDFANVVGLYTAAVAVNNQPDPGLWGDAEQAAMAALMAARGILQADGLDQVATWPRWATGRNPWGYDRSWLALASPSPDVDPVDNVAVLRGDRVDVAVTARTASAFPVSLDLEVDPASGLLVTSLPDGTFQLEAPGDGPMGRFTATVVASDGKYVTRLAFDVDVADGDVPPSTAVYEPVLDIPELDTRHRSFLLDADPWDPFPAP